MSPTSGAEVVLVATELMAEQDVSLAPACAGGRLVGVVNDRDFVIEGSAQGQGPSLVCLGDLSQGEAVTLGTGGSLEEALGVMAVHQVHRLPVIDGDRLVGIVSLADVAQEAGDSEDGATIECSSE